MSLLTDPSHPGEVLAELYLAPPEMSPVALAEQLDVRHECIERLIGGETTVDDDLAGRLARFFSTTPEFWMNLQRNWDIARARRRPGHREHRRVHG